MIRKSKNNEDKPDVKEMWSEVNKNIQEQDAEQDIISRVPELKELSGNIDKATNNCVNATFQCESVIRQYQRAEEKLGNAVDTISGKVDTINEHIDQVMEDAPTKLKVTVNVSDADWQKMQELHNQWMEQEKQALEGHHRQQKESWQKQSQRLHREEQRGCMDFHKTVLLCRFSVPTVNHNDCNGDSVLCVFQVDSIT